MILVFIQFLIKFLENTSMKEDEIILGFYAVSTGNWLQKFRMKKVPSS
jgi:hypothetical protein